MNARGRAFVVVAVLSIAAGSTRDCWSADPFTPEQREEIARMLAQQSACIHAEMQAEYRGEAPPKTPECDAVAAVTTPSQQLAVEEPTQPVQGETLELQQVPSTVYQSAFFRKSGPASNDRDPASGSPQFELSAATDSSKASIRLNKSLSSESVDETGRFNALSATLSSPVSKTDSSVTNIATLDGLANSTTLSLSFQQFFVGGLRSPIKNGDFDPEFKSICLIAGIDVDKKKDGDYPICDSNTVKQGLTKAGRMDLYPAFFATLFDPKALKWTYGLKGSVGHESYDYFDAMTTAAGKSNKAPWGVGAYVGMIPPSSNMFLAMGAEFQRAYQATKTSVLCPTDGDTTAPLKCVSGPFGPPQTKDKHLAYAEFRADLSKVAFDLKVTHDFESGDDGVDLPIYLIKDSKDAWAGGLRLGWTNTDQFIAGIFVTGAFGLLPQ